MANRGGYVNAERFNQLTNDPDTIVIDMRNHYEFEVGHFENASKYHPILFGNNYRWLLI
jgi:UPF0176 protein